MRQLARSQYHMHVTVPCWTYVQRRNYFNSGASHDKNWIRTNCACLYFRMMAGDGDTKDRAPLGTELGKNMGSYYRRPSAAIERGGGFFVPGLQGSRYRIHRWHNRCCVCAAIVDTLLLLESDLRCLR